MEGGESHCQNQYDPASRNCEDEGGEIDHPSGHYRSNMRTLSRNPSLVKPLSFKSVRIAVGCVATKGRPPPLAGNMTLSPDCSRGVSHNQVQAAGVQS